jgi:hypothetical protein
MLFPQNIFLHSIFLKPPQNLYLKYKKYATNTLNIRYQLLLVSAPFCHLQEFYQQQKLVCHTSISVVYFLDLRIFVVDKHPDDRTLVPKRVRVGT